MVAKAAVDTDTGVNAVVGAFADMRENCPYYRGIKDDEDDNQCEHKDNRESGTGTWCAMDCCPLLMAAARKANVGWD